jgi:Tol biopolymer transport system component
VPQSPKLLLAIAVLAMAPVSPDPQIAFASNRDGNWEIYVGDADGQRQTRLTRLDAQDRFPLWSPDRSRIAFGSQIGGERWDLWVMNADGTAPHALATDIVAKGFREWSHDGTRIVFAATVKGDIDIYSVEVATGKIARLTDSPGDDRDPTWSRDGRRIAFSSMRDGNAEIYLMDADGKEQRRLTNHPARDISPAWSRDGATIAFTSTRDSTGRGGDVWLARVADGNAERLTTGAHVTADALRFSPDGKHLAMQTANPDYDIQVVRMSDRQRRAVGNSPFYDGQFSWSPASDGLAFISGRGGIDALYVTDLAGTVRRITTTASLNPAWSP